MKRVTVLYENKLAGLIFCEPARLDLPAPGGALSKKENAYLDRFAARADEIFSKAVLIP